MLQVEKLEQVNPELRLTVDLRRSASRSPYGQVCSLASDSPEGFLTSLSALIGGGHTILATARNWDGGQIIYFNDNTSGRSPWTGIREVTIAKSLSIQFQDEGNTYATASRQVPRTVEDVGTLFKQGHMLLQLTAELANRVEGAPPPQGADAGARGRAEAPRGVPNSHIEPMGDLRSRIQEAGQLLEAVQYQLQRLDSAL